MSDEPVWLPYFDQFTGSYLRGKLGGRKIDLNTMQQGVDHLANAVKVTLGPKGRNVVLDTKFGFPAVTRGGVVVAREMKLIDQDEDAGADLIREVASRTSASVGDGTTTATVLAQAMYRRGATHVAAGANPMEIKVGIDKAVDAITGELKRVARPASNVVLAQVGATASNNDETIGRIVAEALAKVGNDGLIRVEETEDFETSLDLCEGAHFERGYLSPYFVTDPDQMECVLENPVVLIHEKKLSSMTDLLPVLERASLAGRPLFIIAGDIEGEALAALVVNKLRGSLQVAAVKAPGSGDRRKAMLDGIAALTGGRPITDDLGIMLKDGKLEDLGTARKVVVGRDNTTIVWGGGSGSVSEERVEQIRAQIRDAVSEYDRGKPRMQVAKMVGGLAVIKVGAANRAETIEKRARVESAVNAARAAVQYGVVPGGGVALLRAGRVLEGMKLDGDQQLGVDIVAEAIEEPLRWIAQNAGQNGSAVVSNVRKMKGAEGYNALTDVYENLMQAGIVDPAKVVSTALQHAASSTSVLLSTEAFPGFSLPSTGERGPQPAQGPTGTPPPSSPSVEPSKHPDKDAVPSGPLYANHWLEDETRRRSIQDPLSEKSRYWYVFEIARRRGEASSDFSPPDDLDREDHGVVFLEVECDLLANGKKVERRRADYRRGVGLPAQYFELLTAAAGTAVLTLQVIYRNRPIYSRCWELPVTSDEHETAPATPEPEPGGATNHDTTALNTSTFDSVFVASQAGSDTDVGQVGVTGSVDVSNGVTTMNGSGADIWGTADAFNFFYQGLLGDGQIIARVTSLQDTNPYAKAGVMIRASTDPSAADVILDVRPDGSIEFMMRDATGDSTAFLAGASTSIPVWLKLTRSGPVITGSISADGSAWSVVGTTTLSIAPDALIGLAVTSHDFGVLNTATFDSLSR
jgi:chaperonin GroEL